MNFSFLLFCMKKFSFSLIFFFCRINEGRRPTSPLTCFPPSPTTESRAICGPQGLCCSPCCMDSSPSTIRYRQSCSSRSALLNSLSPGQWMLLVLITAFCRPYEIFLSLEVISANQESQKKIVLSDLIQYSFMIGMKSCQKYNFEQH